MCEDRIPVRFFRIRHGFYLYMSQGKDEPFLTSLKVFLGPLSSLKLTHHSNPIRSADCHRVILVTDLGTLTYPSKDSHEPPSWGNHNHVITRLDPADYYITEKKYSVHFHKRPALKKT